jgi:hypothetical protein
MLRSPRPASNGRQAAFEVRGAFESLVAGWRGRGGYDSAFDKESGKEPANLPLGKPLAWLTKCFLKDQIMKIM